MRINVLFPTVMKLEIKRWFEFDEETSFADLKQKIFEVFWRIMHPFSPVGIHGSPDMIILRDVDDKEISSMKVLKDRMTQSLNFSVVFREHPK